MNQWRTCAWVLGVLLLTRSTAAGGQDDWGDSSRPSN